MKTPEFTKMVIASSRAYSWPSTALEETLMQETLMLPAGIMAMLWTCVLSAAYLSNGGEFASI